MTTSPSSIPDEAVEAAVNKLAYLNSEAGDQLTDEEWARAILEAAAPHMLADVWEAAAKATSDYELEYRVSFDFGDDLPELPANPYRSQG